MSNRKSFKGMSLLVLVSALSAATSVKSDDALDKLKVAANTVVATLAFKESHAKTRDGAEFLKYTFDINTQTKQYSLQYKTFAGADAKDNPAMLNDWSSGYGMMLPYTYWYHNGFVSVVLKTADSGCHSFNIAGVPTILEKSGKRIAYDITFKNASGCMVVRTVALAGKDELYIGVFGKSLSDAAGTIESTLGGYPFGFDAPMNRIVYSENLEIKNGDAETELKTAPWLLLSDKLKEDKNEGGMLGLIYDKKTVSKATVDIKNNYCVYIFLATPFKASEVSKQYCMIFTFGKTIVAGAKKLLSEKSGVADKAFEDAFSGLPEPAMSVVE
jgi:hypothetical protein